MSSFYRLDMKVFQIFFQEVLLNVLINAVFRTAPATPGLSISNASGLFIYTWALIDRCHRCNTDNLSTNPITYNRDKFQAIFLGYIRWETSYIDFFRGWFLVINIETRHFHSTKMYLGLFWYQHSALQYLCKYYLASKSLRANCFHHSFQFSIIFSL